MEYGIDLENIPLMSYMETLKATELLPSRKMLHMHIEAYFLSLEQLGFKNIGSLYKGLGQPAKLANVAKAANIPAEYLTLLKREIGSFSAKTVPLTAFSNLPSGLAGKLAEKGIKSSRDVFMASDGFTAKEKFCDIAGVDPEQAAMLFSLCDLVRINGVGAVFAEIILSAGYSSAHDIASADADGLLEAVARVNAGGRFTKVKLGPKDAQYCIDYANALLKNRL